MSATASAGELPFSAQMSQMLAGKWVSRAISVAAELGIADLLAAGERSTKDLAAACGAHEPSLYRLLRALAGCGIFAETAPRTFALTPLAECLRSDAPDSVRGLARFFATPLTWRSWEYLLDCVRTGETGLKPMGVENAFEYLKDHRDEAQIFNEAMTAYSRQEGPAVADAYDFSRFQKVADIAGGHGLLLASVLQRYPAVHGLLFDLPQVIDGAREAIHAANLDTRCETVAGDFFETIPAGADAYMMKHIIHDWDDEQSIRILRNCRRAMAPEGRLLVLEILIPRGNEPSFAKLLDLEMLVIPGGRERTEEEFRALYGAAGFELTAVIPTRSPISIIERRAV